MNIKDLKFQSAAFILMVIAVLLYVGCDSDLLDPKDPPLVESVKAMQYEVDPGDSVRIQVIIDKPNGDVLRFEWQENGGYFLQPSDSSIVFWVAPIVGGTYQISVKVSNEHKSASTEFVEITVRSFVKPAVKIRQPPHNLSIVQYSDIQVEALASHSNGIHHVNFYLNDVFYSQLGGNFDNLYRFPAQLRVAGLVEIRVEAVANVTAITGADSISIRVEGIVLGKP